MNMFLTPLFRSRSLFSSTLCLLVAALLLAGCAVVEEQIADRTMQAAEEHTNDDAGEQGAGGAEEDALTPPDFEPGARALFAEDFSTTDVGSIPGSLESASGSMEVIEWQGQRLLRIDSDASFEVTLPETLPVEFTMEIAHYASETRGNELSIMPVTEKKVRPARVGWMKGEWVAEGGTDPLPSLQPEGEIHRRPARITTTAEGAETEGVKVYIGRRNVVTIANDDFERTRTLRFVAELEEGEQIYIGDIRVAAKK